MAERDPIPADIVMSIGPRPPERDSSLGIAVTVSGEGTPTNRFVTIGDSVTHGFMSAAIHRTELSWPAIVAYELGLELQADGKSRSGSAGGGVTARSGFRYPVYEPPTGPGGLPFDLERVARAFQKRYGSKLNWHEVPSAALWIRKYMDQIEDYWERGDGTKIPATTAPHHNLAVYGWDLLDPQLMTSDIARKRRKAHPPKDALIKQMVERDTDIAALRVLSTCEVGGAGQTVFDAAKRMGEQGTIEQPDQGDGIETLVVVLGANNALGSVVSLDPKWTPKEYPNWSDEEKLKKKGAYNLWHPKAFEADWRRLVTEIEAVRARHVIVATVPQVTIAPICRGVGGRIDQRSRYFKWYTRPWITDETFDEDRDPHFTSEEARAIDSAIDAYNATIIESVRAARNDGKDWRIFDLGGALDSLAARRYQENPLARPTWWEPYALPPQLDALEPKPDTRFYGADESGRTHGGIFSMDGVHPTTSGYGLIANEVIRIMVAAGVTFRSQNGDVRDPKEVAVDFDRILAADGLLSRPPTCVDSSLATLAWLDDLVDWVRGLLPSV